MLVLKKLIVFMVRKSELIFCSKLCNILWLNVGRSDMPRKKYCPARSEFILLNTIYFIGLRKGVSGPGCSQWLLQVQEINAVRM